MTKPFLFFYLLLIIAITGCKDDLLLPDDYSPEGWKPVLAFPLVYGNLNVYDLLEYNNSPENILINDDNTVELIYDGRLFSFDAASAYAIPSQIWQGSYTIPDIGIPNIDQIVQVDITQSFSYTFQTPLDANNDPIQLSEVIFEDGTLQLQLSADVDMEFNGTISLSQLLDQAGNVFSAPVSFTAEQDFGLSIDLSDYGLIMNPANALQIELTGTCSLNAMDVVNGADLAFNMQLQDLAFRSMRGYLGDISIANDRDSIFIDIFRNTVQGYFQLLNPSLRLHIENSIGIPCRIFFDDLETINLNTNETFQLIGSGFPNPLDIAYPQNFNETAVTDVILNNQNSNLQSLLNPAPKILYTSIHAQTNPQGNIGEENFITSQSRFSMDVDLSLPLIGYANLVFSDTLPMNVSEVVTPEEVERIELRNIFSNCFPFEASAQLYFLDENYQLLDSLFTQYQVILPVAEISSGGDLIQSGNTSIDVMLDGERADHFFESRYISVLARGITDNYSEQQIISIRANQKIDFSIGARVFTNLSDIE